MRAGRYVEELLEVVAIYDGHSALQREKSVDSKQHKIQHDESPTLLIILNFPRGKGIASCETDQDYQQGFSVFFNHHIKLSSALFLAGLLQGNTDGIPSIFCETFYIVVLSGYH